VLAKQLAQVEQYGVFASRTPHQQPAMPKGQPQQSGGVLECKGCGRGKHSKDMCNLAGHPDFNTENCWRGQSSKGKAWAARRERYLPTKDLARTLATQPTD
jgi:hypothetical protein